MDHARLDRRADLAHQGRKPCPWCAVLRAAQEAGREPEEITCVYNLEIRVDERADPRSGVVSGSADEVADRLCGFVKLGFTAMNFIPSGPGADEQVERLAKDVIPAVRVMA